MFGLPETKCDGKSRVLRWEKPFWDLTSHFFSLFGTQTRKTRVHTVQMTQTSLSPNIRDSSHHWPWPIKMPALKLEPIRRCCCCRCFCWRPDWKSRPITHSFQMVFPKSRFFARVRNCFNCRCRPIAICLLLSDDVHLWQSKLFSFAARGWFIFLPR